MVKVIDMRTLKVFVINPINKRVMNRAHNLYDNAKKMGIPNIMFKTYLEYSWSLEKGFQWIK